MRTLSLALILGMLATPALAETIHVGVNGLVCAFCASGMEKAFKKVDATESVKVNLDEKLVTVTTKKNKTIDDATITQIVTDGGYTITNIHRQK